MNSISPFGSLPANLSSQSDFDQAATNYARQLQTFAEEANVFFEAVNALMSGAEFMTVSSSSLNLTPSGPRKVAVNATNTGLFVNIPHHSQLSVNGDLWIVANAGSNEFNCGGPLAPGKARGFILFSSEPASRWLLFDVNAWVS